MVDLPPDLRLVGIITHRQLSPVLHGLRVTITGYTINGQRLGVSSILVDVAPLQVRSKEPLKNEKMLQGVFLFVSLFVIEASSEH